MPVVEFVYICGAFFDRNYGEDRSEEWRQAEHRHVQDGVDDDEVAAGGDGGELPG